MELCDLIPLNNSQVPPTNVDPMYAKLSSNAPKRVFCESIYLKLNPTLRALVPKDSKNLALMLVIAFSENLRDKCL